MHKRQGRIDAATVSLVGSVTRTDITWSHRLLVFHCTKYTAFARNELVARNSTIIHCTAAHNSQQVLRICYCMRQKQVPGRTYEAHFRCYIIYNVIITTL
jgi:hypothetical protein